MRSTSGTWSFVLFSLLLGVIGLHLAGVNVTPALRAVVDGAQRLFGTSL